MTSPPPKRKRDILTKAEWEKIHRACVAAEHDPDVAQVLLDDLLPPPAAAVKSA